MPDPLPLPWHPNSVAWPAASRPLKPTLVSRTAPALPLAEAFQVLVTLDPPGGFMLTVHPLVPADAAVTRTVATKPPVHGLSDTDAVRPASAPTHYRCWNCHQSMLSR